MVWWHRKTGCCYMNIVKIIRWRHVFFTIQDIFFHECSRFKSDVLLPVLIWKYWWKNLSFRLTVYWGTLPICWIMKAMKDLKNCTWKLLGCSIKNTANLAPHLKHLSMQSRKFVNMFLYCALSNLLYIIEK